jgi:hypothetical protein
MFYWNQCRVSAWTRVQLALPYISQPHCSHSVSEWKPTWTRMDPRRCRYYITKYLSFSHWVKFFLYCFLPFDPVWALFTLFHGFRIRIIEVVNYHGWKAWVDNRCSTVKYFSETSIIDENFLHPMNLIVISQYERIRVFRSSSLLDSVHVRARSWIYSTHLVSINL